MFHVNLYRHFLLVKRHYEVYHVVFPKPPAYYCKLYATTEGGEAVKSWVREKRPDDLKNREKDETFSQEIGDYKFMLIASELEKIENYREKIVVYRVNVPVALDHLMLSLHSLCGSLYVTGENTSYDNEIVPAIHTLPWNADPKKDEIWYSLKKFEDRCRHEMTKRNLSLPLTRLSDDMDLHSMSG